MRTSPSPVGNRHWTANWIRADVPNETAPLLRATFDLPRKPRSAVAHVLVPGWHELHVNGRRVGDRVLSPFPMAADISVPWLEIDLAPFLRKGRNAVVFHLGNGWFNMFASDCWGFESASWRAAPRVLCEIEADGRVALRTDESWRWCAGPLVYNGLRGGETWDARLEIPGFSDPDFDDSAWKPAIRCVPPGGAPRRDGTVPCRAFPAVDPVARTPLSGEKTGVEIWDFGGSLAGWCELEVIGEAGARVEIDYGERLFPDGDLDKKHLGCLVNGNRFQHDEYVLAGRPAGERWHARFTYYGFRWARTRVTEGRAEIRALRAIPVHPDFASRGAAKISDPVFARLLELTRQSYFDNFAGGFPTDCPHREKNGWTGDAQLAMETGLWNWEGDANYRAHVAVMADQQRPNGAVTCIVPGTRTYYDWGTGPAWDSYLFEVPWQLLRFRGEDDTARRLLPAMRNYLGYALSMGHDGLVDFGLGDWCGPGDVHTPTRLTSSAYILQDARRLAFFARRFGRETEARRWDAVAERLRANLRREFMRPDGSWATGTHTALGCALHFGLCEPGKEDAATARLLAEKVRAERHHARFGILGAKWVPRALAERGFTDDAFRLFVQTEYPGWGHWVAEGATALWEAWKPEASLDHIMFGDLSAWAYEFLGGIRPDIDRPGFSRIVLKPVFPAGLKRFEARHLAPCGEIAVAWRRIRGGVQYTASLPKGVPAEIRLPGLPVERHRGGGVHAWRVHAPC